MPDVGVGQFSPRRFGLPVLVPIALFWFVFYRAGCPTPNLDDLFFVGAAIRLTTHGEFVNPWTPAWNAVLSSGKFYFHPPFYSYLLAGWLWLAGVSTRSFLLFQGGCYLLFSGSMAALLTRFGLPRRAIFGLVLAFAAWQINNGLRHDALGMALLAAGLWLLSEPTKWHWTAGFFLLESAVFTYPITVAYALPFGILMMFLNGPLPGGAAPGAMLANRTTRFGMPLLVATGLVIGLFLLCIRGDLGRFIADFAVHNAIVHRPLPEALLTLARQVLGGGNRLTVLPIWLLLAGLTGYSLLKRIPAAPVAQPLFWSLFAGLMLNILLYSRALNIAIFLGWAGVAGLVWLVHWPARTRIWLVGLAILLLIAPHAPTLIGLFQRETTPTEAYASVHNYVRANPDRIYAVDDEAARHVFDYRLPPRAVAWHWLLTPPRSWPTQVSDKQPGVVWIVSRVTLAFWVPALQPDYPKASFLGQPLPGVPRQPGDVVLIP
jgi:hypothetical protein